ncbi:MAG TPA: hydantoinase/carbamoylase family amidase [Solirubrobacteraceae bacterium]|nr:hydantoinase/carbamoylase family amidase [Solirubrobacteraceae bacterium]
MNIDADRVIADLDELAAASGGRHAGAKRVAWGQGWTAARAWLKEKLEVLPVEVSVDPAGNLWAELAGESEECVILGSHLDSVPSGGWLDGALGVCAALEALRVLAAGGTLAAGNPSTATVRLVDWADEEGRFGRSLLGSSAAAGTLDPDEVRDLVDGEGVRLQDAMAACGVTLDSAPDAAVMLKGAAAYIELHVEQGPVLLEAGRLASAVAGTSGVERHLITFSGEAAHAGSSPIRLRRDSFLAAAAAALAAREVAIAHQGVTTVGGATSSPGIPTAVAGRTELMLDIRHLDAASLASMLEQCLSACEDAAGRFGCSVSARRVFAAAPTEFSAELVSLAGSAVADAGGGDGSPIASGALHDATEVGRVVPTVMIFAQSDPPVSHTPSEDSTHAALRVAIDAFGRTVGSVLADITSRN